MSVGDLAEIRIVFGHDQWRAVVTLSFRALSDDEAWREVLAEEWVSLLGPSWMQALSEQVFVDHLQVDDVVPGGSEPFILPLDGSLRGIQPGDPVPHQVAALVRWYTDTDSRNSRGRSYIYGMPKDDVLAANFWNFGGQNRFQALADATFTAFGPDGVSTGGRLVVISRWLGKVRREVPVSFDITGLEAQHMIATQRRRVYYINIDE